MNFKKKKQKARARPNKSKKKTDKGLIVAFLVMMIGWYVMIFPVSNDLINKIYNINTINIYQSSTQNFSDDEIEKMLQSCREYNETIYEEQKVQTFRYRGPNASDETYERLPAGSQTIGSIRIPDIDVNIAIGHGTKDSMLQGEAGHLYGTSLPVDGENVHAVIAGHSALSTAKLFTDLDELEIGDEFYITVLNQEYRYVIDQIEVMLPTEEAEYEQIVEGKNYVTLYTCTPYGVNTHRLLVRGELAEAKTVELDGHGLNNPYLLQTIKYSAELVFLILLPFFIVLAKFVYTDIRYWQKKRKKAKMKGESV